MIPYCCALVFVGLPAIFLEMSAGQYARYSWGGGDTTPYLLSLTKPGSVMLWGVIAPPPPPPPPPPRRASGGKDNSAPNQNNFHPPK